MGWYPYRGRCTGRVLHFLSHYCGLGIAEHAIIGSDRVRLPSNEPLATYRWSTSFGDADMPMFTFADPRHDVEQARRREEAIADGPPPHDHPRVPVDTAVLMAIIPASVRDARLWSRMLAGVEPAFSRCGTVIRFDAGDATFYWDRDLVMWLRGWEMTK
jgi:hypothetical protein